MMRREIRIRFTLCAGALAIACLFQLPVTAQKQIAGGVQTGLALHRLTVLGSILLIAAHPDDENAALLSYVARGRGGRAAYLSLTRGDGGQNLIGPELGAQLGLIRTQELLASRRIDGGEQYFTRAVDFGFSKSAEETFRKWGRETILEDVVWVVRNYRPDVVVIGVSQGHGHHQAAAILARDAFFAAADPSRFPEQLRLVAPWQAKRLISGGFGGGPAGSAAAGSVRADLGAFNPLLGFSYTEIAGMSRSMHRSQGVGMPQRRGASISTMAVEAGAPAANGDLFDGIDTSWRRFPAGGAVAATLEEAYRGFNPQVPEKTIPLLVKSRALVAAIDDPLARLKLRELDEAIALCAGLYLDASTAGHQFIPGEALEVNFEVTNRSGYPLELTGLKLEGMEGAPSEEFVPIPLENNRPARRSLRLTIPGQHPYSQPYWLRTPGDGNVYPVEDRRMVGLAETPPELTATFRIGAGREIIEFVRPVVCRYVSRTEGETSRPLTVVPPVAVSLADAALLFPDTTAKAVSVRLRANAADLSGSVALEVPPGWRAEPGERPFQMSAAGEDVTATFLVHPPARPGGGRLRAVARVGDRKIDSGMRVIEYPDIPPQTLFPPSTASLLRADVVTLARTVGYVMGAGDEVPRALEQMGCDVTLLGPADLARGDLERFDAVVIGIRAHNVRKDLAGGQARLLDYVHNGGTLVVQYHTADRWSVLDWKAFAPYPIELGGARITVEEAPVDLPNPRHFLLRAPNVIGEADFQGWVQERGLYFPSQWDARYETLYSSHDPGEAALAGGNLYVKYGKGAYVYTSYAWFRQLPAGVSGAYRIFANFLSAARSGP